MTPFATSLARIGGDRFLAIEEVQAVAPEDPGPLWRTYVDHFQRFTAAVSDPQFARLDHPAESFGVPEVPPGSSIVIVGTGPSLTTEADTLRRVRGQVSVWTSLRGAEALEAWGLRPDLIIVQHASDLDAYLTARHVRDRNGRSPLASAPIVLAEPRTPPTLLSNVPRPRIATVDPAIGWGLWPATLAALAATSGASSVGLLGIDLGSRRAVEPAHAALAALLARIAELAGEVATIDYGHGATKVGWLTASMRNASGAERPLVGLRHVAWRRARRFAALDEGLGTIAEALRVADECRAVALAVRDHRGDASLDARLIDLWRTLLDYRDHVHVRVVMQEELGVRFLPRFWREVATAPAGPLWRPALLVAHEIVAQGQAARERLMRARTGTAA